MSTLDDIATEDLSDVFFDSDEFMVKSALLDGSTTIYGMFHNEYALVDQGVGVSSTSPVFRCATTDVSTASEGSTLVIDSVTYKIREFEPDGVGVTVCMLEKQ